MADDIKQVTPEARVGSVSFFEAGDAPRRRERTIIALLATMTVLLLVLVIGLSAGAFWMARQYAVAQQALQIQAGDVRQDLRSAITTSEALARDMLTRQATLSRELSVQAGNMQAQQSQLDRQRAALGEIPKDPLGKADYGIRVTQLTLDEVRAINRHVAATQRVIAKNLSLTPSQEKLLRDLNREPQPGPKK
jgi:uncharacterized protein HemX